MKIGYHYFTFIITILSVMSSAIGIDVYRKCTAAKDSKVYRDLHGFLTYTLTAGITMLLTAMTMIFQKQPSLFIATMLLTMMNIITSGMTLGMVYKCKGELSGDKKTAMEVLSWIGFCLPLFMAVMMIPFGKAPSIGMC